MGVKWTTQTICVLSPLHDGRVTCPGWTTFQWTVNIQLLVDQFQLFPIPAWWIHSWGDGIMPFLALAVALTSTKRVPVRVVGGLESLKRKLLEKDERESLPLCWKNNYESLLVPFLFAEYILNHLLFKQTLFISLFWFWHMSAHANAILMDRAVVKVVAHMHTNSSLWPSLSDLFHLNIVLFALQFVWVFFFAVCHPRSLSEMSVNNEFFCHLFIALGIIFLKDSRTPLESHRKMLYGCNGETNPRLIPLVKKLPQVIVIYL